MAKGQRVGYIRVSTVDQNTARQLDGIQLDRIFEDKASGKDTNRPQLSELLLYVREGDTVVIHSMDRLARNVDDLRRVVTELTEKGIEVEFVKESLKFNGDDSPMSHLVLTVLGAVAEFLRQHQLEAQREGIAKAKEAGKYKGRKKALTQTQIDEIKMRLDQKEAATTIAKDLGISRVTLYKALKPEYLE